MKKIRIGVIFGGRSGEHEVSLVSASSVMQALDPSVYDVVPIGITKDGRWLTGPDVHAHLAGTAGRPSPCMLAPEPGRGLLVQENGQWTDSPLDIIFPVLHGTYGEDGTIQGVFEMADLPYVGSGVLASAAGMDKVLQKRLHAAEGLPIVEYTWFRSEEFDADRGEILDDIERTLGYPVFVKPPNLGSSVGISKARTRDELERAIELARAYDRTVLVERGVPEAREIEVAVLGNGEAIASVPGEVIPSNEFYDYNAKYVDGASATIIPASLDDATAEHVRVLAIAAFHATGCEGLARVDFLLSKTTGDLYLNEVNTMPGFTSISMYPKLFEASGIAYPALLDRLVQLAFERHAQRAAVRRSFEPDVRWFAGGAGA